MDFGPITIDHIGIAAHDFEQASVFWNLLGLTQGEHDETVAEQGVKTRFSAPPKRQLDQSLPR